MYHGFNYIWDKAEIRQCNLVFYSLEHLIEDESRVEITQQIQSTYPDASTYSYI